MTLFFISAALEALGSSANHSLLGACKYSIQTYTFIAFGNFFDDNFVFYIGFQGSREAEVYWW
jgi:hypothetical protein